MSIENYVMEWRTFMLPDSGILYGFADPGTSMRKENHGKIQFK